MGFENGWLLALILLVKWGEAKKGSVRPPKVQGTKSSIHKNKRDNLEKKGNEKMETKAPFFINKL